jgi:RimJ/RimL family protein N-acetyltransferase
MLMESLGDKPALLPERRLMKGQRVTLVPLDADAHAARLFSELGDCPDLWQYMFDPPPPDVTSLHDNLAAKMQKNDPLFYTAIDNPTAQPVGIASYLRIEPVHRVIEVGNIMYSPRLQRTSAATEIMYLMAKYVFEELGYRRYEWKCNALNQPSRRAALRLGFSFEGIFRQHMIIKGANRDTAWFAMLDSEWPTMKAAFEQWLAPTNFDADGKQKHTLEFLRSAS